MPFKDSRLAKLRKRANRTRGRDSASSLAAAANSAVSSSSVKRSKTHRNVLQASAGVSASFHQWMRLWPPSPTITPAHDRAGKGKHKHDERSAAAAVVDNDVNQFARVGASSVVLGEILYTIGGADDKGAFLQSIAAWDLEMKKPLPTIHDDSFPGRNFATACVCDAELFVFGGKSNGYRNDIWSLSLGETTTAESSRDRGKDEAQADSDSDISSDSDSQDESLVKRAALPVLNFQDDSSPLVLAARWKKLDVRGTNPAPRFGHTMVCYAQRLFIFGGFDDMSTACNDIMQFSVAKSTWKKRLPDYRPAARYHHAACLHNSSMFVFGGKGDGSTLFADLWQYNFNTATWFEINLVAAPSARFGHTLFESQGNLCVYGGRGAQNKNDQSSRDVYFASIEMDDTSWNFSAARHPSRNLQSGDAPSGRYYHTSCASGRFVFVIGGLQLGPEPSVLNDVWIQDLPTCYLDCVPVNVLDIIIRYLAPKDLVSFALTSRWNYAAACADHLWIPFLHSHCGVAWDPATATDDSPFSAFSRLMAQGGVPLGRDGKPLIWRNIPLWTAEGLAVTRRVYQRRQNLKEATRG